MRCPAFFLGDGIGGLLGGVLFLGSHVGMMALLAPVSTLAAPVAAPVILGAPGAVVGPLLVRHSGRDVHVQNRSE